MAEKYGTNRFAKTNFRPSSYTLASQFTVPLGLAGEEASELFKDVVKVFQALPLAATIREPEPEPELRTGQVQDSHVAVGEGAGIVVLHAGLPGSDSPHRQSLAEMAGIDRMQPGLDSVCGKVEPATDRRYLDYFSMIENLSLQFIYDYR
jgi:hypothetical protein